MKIEEYKRRVRRKNILIGLLFCYVVVFAFLFGYFWINQMDIQKERIINYCLNVFWNYNANQSSGFK
jgi:hypothetical protein